MNSTLRSMNCVCCPSACAGVCCRAFMCRAFSAEMAR